jgi:biopolymer transport protein ExbD
LVALSWKKYQSNQKEDLWMVSIPLLVTALIPVLLLVLSAVSVMAITFTRWLKSSRPAVTTATSMAQDEESAVAV